MSSHANRTATPQSHHLPFTPPNNYLSTKNSDSPLKPRLAAQFTSSASSCSRVCREISSSHKRATSTVEDSSLSITPSITPSHTRDGSTSRCTVRSGFSRSASPSISTSPPKSKCSTFGFSSLSHVSINNSPNRPLTSSRLRLPNCKPKSDHDYYPPSPSTKSTPTIRVGKSSIPSPGLTIVFPDTSSKATTSSRFIRADDVKQLDSSTSPGKKMPTFFYANGVKEDFSPRIPLSNRSSPRSMVCSLKSPQLTTNHYDDLKAKSSILSNPLSSKSSANVSSELTATPNCTTATSSKLPLHSTYQNINSNVDKIPKHAKRENSVGSQVSKPVTGTTSEDVNNSEIRITSQGNSLLRPIGNVDQIKPRNKEQWTNQLREINETDTGKVAATAESQMTVVQQTISTVNTSSGSIRPTQSCERGACQTTITTNFHETGDISSPITSSPSSPSKIGSQSLCLDDAAANARRNRKVLDLEISNSSLLAINRQLEREIRKQKSEIRRFRRLTRWGRISDLSCKTLTASRPTSSEVGAGNGSQELLLSVSGLGESMEDLDSTSDSNEFNDREIFSAESESESESSSQSNSADSFKLMKDEKILQQDLAKHRQLIVDCQKINQSLTKCLGWTEELIISGKKALEYTVLASDIRGGRVLPEECIESLESRIPNEYPDEGPPERPKEDGSILSVWGSKSRRDETALVNDNVATCTSNFTQPNVNEEIKGSYEDLIADFLDAL